MTLIYIRLGSLTLSLTTLAFSQLATYVLAEPILICKRSMMKFAFWVKSIDISASTLLVLCTRHEVEKMIVSDCRKHMSMCHIHFNLFFLF